MFKKVKWSTYLVLLAFLLIVGVVGGCSNDSNDESKQSSDNNDDEAPTVRVFKSHLGKGKLPESDDPHVEYIKEETGVEYELENVPTGSEAAEYLNNILASGDLPDILRPIDGVERTLIEQDGALALDDLLPEYAPHVWERIPDDAWDIVRSASPDGKIYYVPKVYLIPERAALIRQDWIDAVGHDMPETIEDYKDLLTAFRDDDPNGNGEADEFPTSGRENGEWMDHLFAAFGVAMWEGVPEWDIYDGDINYAGTSDNMKAAIEFIRELYEEKLLDNETFLNSGDVWTSKINNDLVGSWYHLPANLNDRYEAIISNNPDAYVVGMPLPEVDGFEGFITQKSVGEPEWMIPAEAEDKAADALKLLDFFYDPDNHDFVTFGIEDQHHEVVDGEKVLIPPNDDTPVALGMDNYTTQETMDTRIETTVPEDRQKMIKDIFEVSTEDARIIAGDGLPSSVYSGYPDIQSHKLFQEYMTKIVIGEWPLEKFDEFVEKWNEAGGEEVTERVQEWYEEVNN